MMPCPLQNKPTFLRPATSTRQNYLFRRLLLSINLLTVLSLICGETKYSALPKIVNNVGLLLEPAEPVYLQSGYALHDVVIGLPQDITPYMPNRLCDKGTILGDGTAQKILNHAYAQQLNVLYNTIPISKITDQIDGIETRNVSRALITNTEISSLNLHREGRTYLNCSDKILDRLLAPNVTPCTSDNLRSNGFLSIKKERGKREIITAMAIAGGIALAGSGLVTSLMNSGKLGEIRERIDVMVDKNNEIIDIMHRLADADNKIGSRLDNLTSIVLPDLIGQINRLYDSISCSDIESLVLMIESRSWLSNIPSKIMRIINSAYAGKIIPDILPVNVVLEILNERRDLEGSIYHKRPDLLYELGKAVILQVNHDPFLIHTSIMIPIISEDEKNIGYNARIVNYFIDGANYLLDVKPSVALDPATGTAWRVDSGICSRSAKYTVCPSECVSIYADTCLTNIFSDNATTGFTSTSLRPEEAVVQNTPYALYLGGGPAVYTITTIRSSGRPVIEKKKIPQFPYLIPKTDGDYIEHNGKIYA